MAEPIIIYRPKVELQPLDAAGVPDGAHVDVSCDFRALAIDASVPITNVPTFCGVFQSAGDVEPSAEATLVILDDTTSRWSALAGRVCDVRVWHRSDATSHRTFKTLISFDPSLYGNTEPGTDGLTVTMALPVYESPAWAAGAFPTV